MKFSCFLWIEEFFSIVLNESAFAQHCFFKSLQLQRSAIVYTNLGFLYYRYENIQLANKAFSNAQQTDPMYSLAWIGQVKHHLFLFFCLFLSKLKTFSGTYC